ncbi:MAG: YggS family pyridoxal phosphate-dependent enzyme [Alphaproteobacteria bacterium]|nr:YggS family pyridoxal phosphate-dependent enzyme [Alphaproteobacteria bacterium]
MTSAPTHPVDNLHAIRRELKAALIEARRETADVVITAVSKTHDASHILPVLEAGHRVFGENRVQEAMEKWPPLRASFPDLELHLIGPLQTNKASAAVAFFDVIETVDRPKLARVLGAEMAKQDKYPALYIQINTGEEEQKAGITPCEADAFIAQCRTEYGLTIEGLMCIPPAGDDPAPHFALLAKIAARNGISQLSMGMSGDYLIAAQMGATHLRIGSAIFGAR